MMRTLKHSSVGATILVVNGDDTTGNLLQDVLAKEGYDVHHAGSAQEMWQVLDQRSVDLILLRLHLMDAFGLCLTLAKGVLELHGGSVSLKGTKAGGTAVTLTLPGLVASLDAYP